MCRIYIIISAIDICWFLNIAHRVCVTHLHYRRMILTGERMTAQEACDAGLVARVFPADHLVDETIKVAKIIASKGRMATMMAKEAVNAADELTLQEGLRFERRLFHALFATADQKEGMSAFLDKREAHFTHK
jgi:enoyl-CoA hydratase/carnithine racemase